MHTCLGKLGRQAWNQKLLQQTVAHTAGNIHEMHKHIFVFGVELHPTAQYPWQLVDSPRPLKRGWLPSGYETHQSTSTEQLMAAVRV